MFFQVLRLFLIKIEMQNKIDHKDEHLMMIANCFLMRANGFTIYRFLELNTETNIDFNLSLK